MAIPSASHVNTLVTRFDIDHPTASRFPKSNTTAKYSHPSLVQMYVMSHTQTRFTSATEKSRFNTFSATGWLCAESVVTRNRRGLSTRIPFSRMSLAT
jgi:hypothetical protein